MVLEKEIQSLLKLKSSLYNSFIQSCKLIKQTFGKTIFVGLGKSGHIAEKFDTFIFGFIHKNTIL
jgi:D-arabinose 5-phosphate isomerase GutQ